MQKNRSGITVFFEDPFWVAIYERSSDGWMQACKITFVAEPKDYEVYEWLLENWHRLAFSPPVRCNEKADNAINPKRKQRKIKKQLETRGVGTKSMQALQLQREQNKVTRATTARAKKQEEKEQQYQLRQQKRKAKHRGR